MAQRCVYISLTEQYSRVAQRAFRERKQSQIAELQARLQSYEKGEVERSVALQSIAKRLKEENEKLLKENLLLKEKLSNIGESESGRSERKRLRNDSPPTLSAIARSRADYFGRKRSKSLCDSAHPQIPEFETFLVPSPSSLISSPDCEIAPISSDPPPQGSQAILQQPSSLTSLLDFSSDTKANNLDSGVTFTGFDCGLCDSDSSCVCQDVALPGTSRQAPLKMADFERRCSRKSTEQVLHPTAMPACGMSILDNLPGYQPPIPLPWSGLPKSKSIFPVSAQLQPPSNVAPTSCSGDPANCTACANDPFGKAFCQAVQYSTNAMPLCVSCPCCPDPAIGTGVELASIGVTSRGVECGSWGSSCPETSLLTSNSSSNSQPGTIPTSEAWRQLKSHPNVEFTDLALLADVVVHDSRCAGPQQTVLTPDVVTPSSNTERLDSDGDRQLQDRQVIDGEDEESRYPRGLVPHNALMDCGRRRVREVRTDALNAALRLLDTKFGRT